MDETFKSFLLPILSLMAFGELRVASADNSTYFTCLVSAAKFYEKLELSFCSGLLKNPWNESYETCAKICTIRTENTSCGKSELVLVRFNMDKNLPTHVYSFANCSTCFNVTQVNITCNLSVIIWKTKRSLTINEEESTTEIVSSTSDIQVSVTVAAALSGVVFGALLTIGVWIIKQRLSKDKSWQRRSTVQNPTYNASPRSSDPEPVPDVSRNNEYKEVIPKSKRSYNPREDSDTYMYNHLHETTNNTEDISSPYDHAPYVSQYGRTQPETFLDSGYMHINKLA